MTSGRLGGLLQPGRGGRVGFGISRLTSQLNRKLYDGFWLYHEAKKIDEVAGRGLRDGTSVRAGLDIPRKRGHREVRKDTPTRRRSAVPPTLGARSVDDVLTTSATAALTTSTSSTPGAAATWVASHRCPRAK